MQVLEREEVFVGLAVATPPVTELGREVDALLSKLAEILGLERSEVREKLRCTNAQDEASLRRSRKALKQIIESLQPPGFPEEHAQRAFNLLMKGVLSLGRVDDALQVLRAGSPRSPWELFAAGLPNDAWLVGIGRIDSACSSD